MQANTYDTIAAEREEKKIVKQQRQTAHFNSNGLLNRLSKIEIKTLFQFALAFLTFYLQVQI